MAVLPPDPVFTLRAPELAPIHSICFDCHDGIEQLLVGTQNGYVVGWNLKTNRQHFKMSVGETAILNIQHSGDNFYTQEKSGIFKLWTRAGKEYSLKKTINSEYCSFCRFHISDSGNMLFIPERDSKIVVYTADGEQTKILTLGGEYKVGEVMCFKYINLSDTNYLLAAYESGDLFLWDVDEQKIISNVKLRDFPLALDYDTVSGRGIYGNASENIQVFSISRNDLQLSLKCEVIMKNAGVNVLKIRHDKKVFVSGGWDGKIRVYSWKSLRPLAVLTEHKSSVQDISYSTQPISMWNSFIMASGGLDSTVSLWDIYN